MQKRQVYLAVFMCMAFTLCLVGTGFCFGKKELETEASAVKLLREVEQGGYKIVTTEELKAGSTRTKTWSLWTPCLMRRVTKRIT